MDNDPGIDIAEVIGAIGAAEVMTFRFVIVGQRVLVDMRTSEIDGPMVKIVQRASSAEERFRSLKQLRPRFRLPDRIATISWPRYVASLGSCGVWDALLRRIAGTGFPQAAEDARRLFEELCSLERDEIRNAISGKGFETLWECKA